MAARVRGGQKLRRFLKTAGKGGAKGVRVGVFKNARYPASRGGRYVAEVAAWMEYGTKQPVKFKKKGKPRAQHVPPRPFFRPGIKRGEREARKVLLTYINPKRGIVTPSTAGRVGLTFQKAVQKALQDVTSPPLAASTIKRKKSSKPLIDEGVLKQSITFKVLRA